MQVNENGLNDRQRRFASLIVKGHAAKVAYAKAFPRCKAVVTAEVEGCKLLRNPRVAAYIKKLRDEDNEKLALDRIVSKREMLEFLTTVIRTPAGAIDKNDPLCQSFKDSEKEHEIKLPDKLRAAERICKIMGWDAPMKLEEERKFAPPTPEDNQRGIEILARWANFAPRRIKAQEVQS